MDNKFQNTSLLNFPCDFTIKVFGNATPEFEKTVLMIVKNHISHLKEDALKTRPSKDGKFLAMSITINVDNREQLDNLYRDLSASPLILLVL